MPLHKSSHYSKNYTNTLESLIAKKNHKHLRVSTKAARDTYFSNVIVQETHTYYLICMCVCVCGGWFHPNTS